MSIADATQWLLRGDRDVYQVWSARGCGLDEPSVWIDAAAGCALLGAWRSTVRYQVRAERIVERGNHATLDAARRRHYQLYERQHRFDSNRFGSGGESPGQGVCTFACVDPSCGVATR